MTALAGPRGMRGALAVWRSRAPRSLADAAYLAYVVVLSALILLGPGVRAVWLAATSADGRAVLGDPAVASAWASATAFAWVAALAAGTERGPALRPPFRTEVLAGADLPRTAAFGGPVLRATLSLALAGALVPLLPVLALIDQGLAAGSAVGWVAAAGAAAGVVAAGLWLLGQAAPGAAAAGAVAVAGTAALLAETEGWRWAPWSLVGVAWPVGGDAGPGAAVGPGAGLALAVAVVAVAPALLAGLRASALVGQAVRAQRAQTLVAAMDLQTAGEVYRARPWALRAVRAVGRVAGPGAVVVADAVGVLRAPGRLAAGVGALVAAGALSDLVVADVLAGPAIAAVLGYAGVSVLCDGVRHAAALGRSSSQYGWPALVLLALHAVLPVLVGAGCATLGALVWSGDLLGAPIVVVLVAGVRVADALKGPMPVDLLVPMLTPAGDVSAVGRMAWLADGPLLVLAVGVAAAVPGARVLAIAAAVVAAVVAVRAARA